MTGGATMFSFLEPWRPLLIIVSVSILGFGFYQEYKSKNIEAMKPCCRANAEKKSKRNRRFLWAMTFVSVLLFSFPLYSNLFIGANATQIIGIQNTKTVELSIGGMNCQGCANNLMLGLSKVNGVIKDTVVFETAKATITFDEKKISDKQIIKRIEDIGFRVNKNKNAEVLQSEITCPKCGHRKMETLPTDVCLLKYTCEKCKADFFPKNGDCCVFCSYGSIKCPSKQ